MSPKAFITGISGQDGSYLAEKLLAQGYEILGLLMPGEKPTSCCFYNGLDESAKSRLSFKQGDLLEKSLFFWLFRTFQPDRIFHLAAMSNVVESFKNPLLAAEINGAATMRLLEAARVCSPAARIFLACSCEIFGPTAQPADESTPFYPTNPYAVSKEMVYWSGINYRESYGMFIGSGIFYNHESPRRAPAFVSKKVARAVAEIYTGKRTSLALGNLQPLRDWGYAPEFMDAAIQILDAETADDYVIATGQSHSVEEYVNTAFHVLNLDPQAYVTQDKSLFRPSDSRQMLANPAKIKKQIGWEAKTMFHDLVAIMVESELRALEANQ
jgi:GDPmannose 4,6-dehydratase